MFQARLCVISMGSLLWDQVDDIRVHRGGSLTLEHFKDSAFMRRANTSL